jgi:hypothetical protein
VTDAFKGSSEKSRPARRSRDEAARLRQMMSGEATPSQMGGLLMALRVRGETVDEITGAVSAMRAKMLRVEGAARRRRRGRHRRRRFRLVQHFDLRRVHRRRRRRAGRQARQSRAVVALGRRRRAGGARRQDRHHAGADRPLHRRGRHRLHVRAGASSGDEERRPDPRRTWHPHDLQSARPAVQSGRRQAADGRGVFPAMGAAAGAGAEEPRRRIRLGGARLRRARRNHHSPARPASRRSRTAISAPSRFRRKKLGLRRSSRRRCAAATRRQRQAVQSVLDGKPSAFRDVALLNAAAALVVAGKAKDLKASRSALADSHSVDSG